MENWYEMLKEKFKYTEDDFEKKICTLSDEELKKDFDSGYGRTEGAPFTAWGEKWVYFPICYDGAEWVGSVPRNPCDISLEHQGGG